MTERLDVDVLIVGAGPVGLTAALLLDRLGCSVVIVERRGGPQRAPAAHVVNARTFEVWRQIGLDVDHIRSHAKDPADAGAVHWVTKLGGDVIGSLPYERQGDENLSLTPTPLRNLSQHRLEPLLVDELTARGIDVRYDHRWESCDQDDDAVTSLIQGPDGPVTVRSCWLLACDGASSPVRRSTGIEPEGPDRIQSLVMVHLAADMRSAVGDHPGVLFWVCDPASIGAFVAHDIDREWVYMRSYDPELEEPSAYTADRCDRLVRAALQDPTVEFEILNVSTWTMTAQVAARYRDGRIFLVGDSAHRFPPTGGMGLNTGVGDAHNLAWRVAAVLHGAADPDVLDDYEAERRPVALRNAEVSLENAFKLLEVPVALGADDDIDVFTSNMTATLADADGRCRVEAAIADQATHFDMLGLQLGYRYDIDRSDLDRSGTPPAGVDPVRTYLPSSRPGGRLPHGWIRRGGIVCSTLDLIPLDRSVLIAGPLCETAEPDLRVGVDFDDLGHWWRDVLELPDEGALLVRPDQHIAERWSAMSSPATTKETSTCSDS